MRLDYWILVVDDQADAIESVGESVEAYLNDEGIGLKWQIVSGTRALEDELERDKSLGRAPDLVLVDKKLGTQFDGMEGPHWAHQLRTTFPYTDILFYSSAGSPSTLREEIFNAGVDGVYSCRRDNLDEVAKRVIGVHVQRWIEPAATRALVVGQVVDFDESFRALARTFAPAVSDEMLKTVSEEHRDRVLEDARKKVERFERYARSSDYSGLVNDFDLGSFWIPDLARDLVVATDGSVSRDFSAFLRRYREEVIWIRNLLAHAVFDVEGQEFKGSKGSFPATADSCRALRASLRSYRAAIEQLASTKPGESIKIELSMPPLRPA